VSLISRDFLKTAAAVTTAAAGRAASFSMAGESAAKIADASAGSKSFPKSFSRKIRYVEESPERRYVLRQSFRDISWGFY